MIVDLERNDLSRVCEPGSVRWPELMAERELAGVAHLVSHVEGTLREDVGARRAARGDLPGRLGHRRAEDRRARPDRARSSRSAAARRWARSGTVRGNGDLELALTIRTFAVADGRIHLWVGGGIVWDSDPEAEIEESWTKARPLLAAIGAPLEAASCGERCSRVAVGGRGVVDPGEPVLRADDEALLRGRAAFETLRVYGGAPFRLAEHLARLGASAERIGLPAVNRLELEELAARRRSTAAGAPDAVLRLFWTPTRRPVARARQRAAEPLRRAARARASG